MASTHRVYPKNGRVDPNYVLPPSPSRTTPKPGRTPRSSIRASWRWTTAWAWCWTPSGRQAVRRLHHRLYHRPRGGVPQYEMPPVRYRIGVALMLRYPGNLEGDSHGRAVQPFRPVPPPSASWRACSRPPGCRAFLCARCWKAAPDRCRTSCLRKSPTMPLTSPCAASAPGVTNTSGFSTTWTASPQQHRRRPPQKRSSARRVISTVPIPRELLFDLTLDPVERVNLAEDPQLQDVLSGLRVRLQGM